MANRYRTDNNWAFWWVEPSIVRRGGSIDDQAFRNSA